jgi:hypothetical protein
MIRTVARQVETHHRSRGTLIGRSSRAHHQASGTGDWGSSALSLVSGGRQASRFPGGCARSLPPGRKQAGGRSGRQAGPGGPGNCRGGAPRRIPRGPAQCPPESPHSEEASNSRRTGASPGLGLRRFSEGAECSQRTSGPVVLSHLRTLVAACELEAVPVTCVPRVDHFVATARLATASANLDRPGSHGCHQLHIILYSSKSHFQEATLRHEQPPCRAQEN